MFNVTSPLPNQVYQRSAQGRAYVTLTGTASADIKAVEALFTPVKAGVRQAITLVCVDGRFAADVVLVQGDYSLSLTPVLANGPSIELRAVQNVGVGDIFCIAGHSVSAGDDRNGSAVRTPDERVYCVAINSSDPTYLAYQKSGNPDLLPTAIVPYGEHSIPGPFGTGTNFWAKFGDDYVAKHNVPILILNAAFGGTNIDQWAKATQGLPFEHGFCDWKIRMPYINLKNCFLKYTAVSGIRGLLMDHGANDWLNNDYEAIFKSFKRVIEQVRTDSGAPDLGVIIARHTPFGKTGIRAVQERVIREIPGVIAGPDYDAIPTQSVENSVDTIHLTAAGQTKVGAAWAKALPADVLALLNPHQAKPVPVITPLPNLTAGLLPDNAPEPTPKKAGWLPLKRVSVVVVVVVALLVGVVMYYIGRRTGLQTAR